MQACTSVAEQAVRPASPRPRRSRCIGGPNPARGAGRIGVAADAGDLDSRAAGSRLAQRGGPKRESGRADARARHGRRRNREAGRCSGCGGHAASGFDWLEG